MLIVVFTAPPVTTLFAPTKEHSLKLCEPRRTYFWMQWLCWLSATVYALSAGSSNLNPIPFFTGWTWLVSTLLLLANISFEVWSVSHQIYLEFEVSICKNLTTRRFCSSPERELAEGDGYEPVRDRSDQYRGHRIEPGLCFQHCVRRRRADDQGRHALSERSPALGAEHQDPAALGQGHQL